MKISSRTIACLLFVIGAPTCLRAQGAGPYSPTQVYWLFTDAIRQAFSIPENDPSQTYWLSLSNVGTIVTTDQPAHLNDLANFCPEPTAVISAFTREPKLDAVYERLIEGTVPPVKTFSQDYKKARALLFNGADLTAKYKKYRDLQAKWTTAWSKYYNATDAGQRAALALAMDNAEQDWNLTGYRSEVDDALNTISQEEYAAGVTNQAVRRSVLRNYKAAAPRDISVPGAYVSPTSSMSPDPSKWDASTSWVKVNYDVKDTISRYSESSSHREGFGGLSLGFVTIAATGGGSGGSVSKVNQVYNLTYQFEVLRVSIKRDWLDTVLLFEPLNWTWKKDPATSTFPYVAVARDKDGLPQPSPAVKYNNVSINCALLPVEAVVARNRKIVATVSKTDYSSVESSGSAEGGGSLFGIFGGGGKQSWSTKKISDDGHFVTFSVESTGTAVIGLISQFVPKSPDPNLQSKWPDNAWLPPQPIAQPPSPTPH